MGKLKFQKLTPKEVIDVESTYKKHYDFISNITQYFPNSAHSQDSNDVDDHSKPRSSISLPARLCPAKGNNKKPARTVDELQAKLSQLRSKPSLAYKEKLQKKGLKTRLKKREKKEKRKVKRLEAKAFTKAQKLEGKEQKPSVKPVYNNEGEMVFSKFDFSELGTKIDKKVKVIKDPKIALKKVKEYNDKLRKLEKDGHKSKALEIKEKKAWKTALLKAEGVKIKDDPEMLKASIKNVKKKKEKSEARWKANTKRVVKEKEEKQRKRTENLQARSKEKKLKKMKTLAKRGRIIAGF